MERTMSQSLSPDEHALLRKLANEWDTAPKLGLRRANPPEVAAATLMQRARGALAEALANDKVSVRELARRLNVSPAAVSRMMNSEGDVRLGTLAVCAHALGREWTMELRQIDHGPYQASNYRVVVPRKSSVPTAGAGASVSNKDAFLSVVT